MMKFLLFLLFHLFISSVLVMEILGESVKQECFKHAFPPGAVFSPWEIKMETVFEWNVSASMRSTQ